MQSTLGSTASQFKSIQREARLINFGVGGPGWLLPQHPTDLFTPSVIRIAKGIAKTVSKQLLKPIRHDGA